jgi:hypothetical protein
MQVDWLTNYANVFEYESDVTVTGHLKAKSTGRVGCQFSKLLVGIRILENHTAALGLDERAIETFSQPDDSTNPVDRHFWGDAVSSQHTRLSE